MKSIARMYHRIMDRNKWWVCEYKSDRGESGSFACNSAHYSDAKTEAENYIRSHAFTRGSFEFVVRRPTIVEVIFG